MKKLSQLCVLILIVLLPLIGVSRARAADTRTFPETGHTVGGLFYSYWQQNGALPVFGYPLTDAIKEQERDVQYFERQRFEAHPDEKAPYNVLLGRLGDELLRRHKIDWQVDIPAATEKPGCMWFPQTNHNICDQAKGLGFASYWQSHGLSFDSMGTSYSYAESLALFGFPLTEARVEKVEGQEFLVQWFERARLEWHPENPDAYKVLQGRLGAEIMTTPELPQDHPGMTESVKLYMVAIDDNGKSGPKIGCGDSLIEVEVPIEPTTAPLTAAYTKLLSLKDRVYGQSGLYNALYQSSLTLDRATVENGVAKVELSGSFMLGGACDSPRVQAELEQVAHQFPTVDHVEVFVNGQSLADALSEK